MEAVQEHVSSTALDVGSPRMGEWVTVAVEGHDIGGNLAAAVNANVGVEARQVVCEVGQARPACGGSSCRRWSWRSGQTAVATQTSSAVCGGREEDGTAAFALLDHIDLVVFGFGNVVL